MIKEKKKATSPTAELLFCDVVMRENAEAVEKGGKDEQKIQEIQFQKQRTVFSGGAEGEGGEVELPLAVAACEVAEGDDVDPRGGHDLGSMRPPRGPTWSQTEERLWRWPSPLWTPPPHPQSEATANRTNHRGVI